MLKQSIFIILLLVVITTKAHMVTITANSTNILTQYSTDESCKATLKALKINNTCSEVRKVINAFDRDQTMVAVILHESNFDRTQVHVNTSGSLKGTKDIGIFQLNNYYFKTNGNIDDSIKIAKSLKITAWSAYNNGMYKKHLKDAKMLIENI